MGKRGTARKAIACSAYFFLPIPPPLRPTFPSFALAPPLKAAISTLPNLPLSQNQRWRLQQTNINNLSHSQNTRGLHCRLEKRRLVNDHVTITIINKVIRDTSE